jgi:aminoglycoside/choline kinase family phosphotransferase
LNPSSIDANDARLAALRTWLKQSLDGAAFTLVPASADASFRRYFRLAFDDGTRIAMDAPPEREDSRAFVRVAQLLRDAGVHVPDVIASDLERGFLLLSDLGDTTYLHALTETNADTLFADATGALIRWQCASRAAVLPPYDRGLLQREMDLFPDWYVRRHLGIDLTGDQRVALASVTTLLADSALAQPAVFVHRDFMPRNLMVSEPNPGVLDFQDAVYGPITYDVVSLFRDAFISWPEERVLDWTVRYWEQAKRARLPVDADFGAFYRAFEWMGLQRHLKVLGIFARICYRDGKPAYLKDASRFLDYARGVCGRYASLAPLTRLLDHLEQRSSQVGYTF